MKKKKWLALRAPRLLLEIATIVFGVLLGLWLSEVQSNRQDDRFVEKSVSVMKDELARNFESLQVARKYHLELLPDLIIARDAERNSETVPELNYYGFGTAETSTAAYQTALSAGVFAKLDPEYSAKFAEAYTRLSAVSETSDRYKLSLSLRRDDFLEIMPFAFSDLLYGEDAALQAMATLIDEDAPISWLRETEARPY
ncbi:MAG: hypothetical protein AAGJ50_10845 [Pseudomonadota bacterium]